MDIFTLVGKIVIETNNAETTIDNVVTKAQGLSDNIAGIGNTAENALGSKSTNSGFGAAAVWMGNMLTDLTHKATEFGKTLWNTGFNMNLNMESWTASFKTYLGGDLEAAEALVERLKQFAIDTPLTLQEVMAQATQLLATGTEPDKLIEVLGTLGDISRGDMSYFSKISTAYWQIMTTGRLLAQDANQLTQAGVPVWQLVADYFNVIERDGRTDWTKSDTKGLASQAALLKNPDLAISGDELYSALLFSTSENGMYFNAMNNAMDTTKGKLEKLNDAFAQFAATLTQPFTDVMGTETLDKMTATFDKFITWAEENPEVLNNLAQALSDLAVNGLGVLLDGLKEFLTFANEYSDVLNTFLVLAGASLLLTGNYKAGAVILSAGGLGTLSEIEKAVTPEADDLYADYPNIAAAKKSGDFSGLSEEEMAIYNWRESPPSQFWRLYQKGWDLSTTLQSMMFGGPLGGVFAEEIKKYIFDTPKETNENSSDDMPQSSFERRVADSLEMYSEMNSRGKTKLVDEIATDYGVEETKVQELFDQMIEAQKSQTDIWKWLTNENSSDNTPQSPLESVVADFLEDYSEMNSWGKTKLVDEIAANYGVEETKVQELFDQMIEAQKSQTDVWKWLTGDTTTMNDPASTLDEITARGSVLPGDTAKQTGVLGMLAQIFTNVKADITAAAKDGVAAGMSGITITGTVTTGDVMFDDGTLVGKIAPQINLQLGWQGKMDSRGSA